MNIDEQAAADAIMSARHSDAFDREACLKILRDNLSGGVESRHASHSAAGGFPGASSNRAVDKPDAIQTTDFPSDSGSSDPSAQPLQPKPESWQNKIADFVNLILHGDDIHKAWLREAGEAFILGKPLPPARKGLEPRKLELGLNFVTLNFPDCNGNKIKVVPTMEGNLQIGDWAAIITSDEFEAILQLRDKAIRK
jgi:hypothetical protein